MPEIISNVKSTEPKLEQHTISSNTAITVTLATEL